MELFKRAAKKYVMTQEEKLDEIADLFSENLSTFKSACEECKGIEVTSMKQWAEAVSKCKNGCNLKLCLEVLTRNP